MYRGRKNIVKMYDGAFVKYYNIVRRIYFYEYTNINSEFIKHIRANLKTHRDKLF